MTKKTAQAVRGLGGNGLTARVDPSAGTVTFRVSDSEFEAFKVHEHDIVRWDLSGVPAGWNARVRFVGFPAGPEHPLLERGNTLEGVGGNIDGGAVRFAPDGIYVYVIELVDAQGSVNKLQVLIKAGPAAPAPAEAKLRKEMLSGTGGLEDGNPGGGGR